MAGGISAWPQVGNPQDIATAGSGLTGVASGAGTFTKGAWTQMVASTTYAASLMLYQVAKPSGANSCAIDIGIGSAGNEIALISNLVIESTIQVSQIFHFPISIPAGQRISIRCSTDTASQTIYQRLTLLDNTATSDGVPSIYDTYGFVSGTGCGTTVDPGASADTKGAYSQLTASTTNDLAGFMLTFDQQGRTTGTSSGDYAIDIAVGSAGNEKAILPNTWNFLNSAVSMQIRNTGFIPMPIRAGSRIAARAQSAVTTSPNRIIGITLVGMRQ